MDKRIKYKVGESVKEAIYQVGGIRRFSERSPFAVSTLYKYIDNNYNILHRKACMLANALKLKPIFSNGVFDVKVRYAQTPQLISPNYCFNCGNKLKEATDGQLK